MTPERLLALMLGVGGAAGVLGFLATMEPVVGLGVFVAVLGLYLLWRAPVRISYLTLVAAGLIAESPDERPFAGHWHSPLAPLGRILFETLHHTTHIPFLRVSGMELLLLALFALVLVRKAWKLPVDPAPLPSPTPLRQALLLGFITLLALEVWGVIGRGGDLKQSLFQFRVLAFTPLVAYLGLYALRGPRDAAVLGRIIVGAAMYRALLGAYFYFFIVKPQELWPPYMTTHTDTVLFVLGVMVLVARYWEDPSWVRFFEAMAGGFVIAIGLYLNDRRLAYVTLAMCLGIMYLVSPWNRVRRFLTRVAFASIPLLIAYVTVGWNHNGRIFKPVQVVKTVVLPDRNSESEEDSSTEFRFMENFNLIQTWRQSPVVGVGFGHEYLEVIQLPDISKFMPEYRFQPHNGVLWLLGIGGLLGFTCMWLYLAVAVFFASRAYHALARPVERAMALVGLSAVIAYLNQVYGDMGSQSYTSVLTLAPMVALVGQLAVSSGAWREASRRPREAVAS